MCLLGSCVGTIGAVLFGMAVKTGGLPPLLLRWEIVVGVLIAQVIVGLAGRIVSAIKLYRLEP